MNIFSKFEQLENRSMSDKFPGIAWSEVLSRFSSSVCCQLEVISAIFLGFSVIAGAAPTVLRRLEDRPHHQRVFWLLGFLSNTHIAESFVCQRSWQWSLWVSHSSSRVFVQLIWCISFGVSAGFNENWGRISLQRYRLWTFNNVCSAMRSSALHLKSLFSAFSIISSQYLLSVH